jgi:hypothetical protein
LIIAGGKEHWLTEREGMVYAKGKGEMKVECGRAFDRNCKSPVSKLSSNFARFHFDLLVRSFSIVGTCESQTSFDRLGQPLDDQGASESQMPWPRSYGDRSVLLEVILTRALIAIPVLMRTATASIPATKKLDRLIDWNVEVLVGLLEKVMSRRFEAARSNAVEIPRTDSWATRATFSMR